MSYRLKKSEKELLFAVRDYIKEHLNEGLSQKTLSRKAQMNKVKYCRGFRELFGSNPSVYILAQRMAFAHSIIAGTDKPIKEISSLAGYRNVKSFHRVFIKFYGFTPSSLRN